MEIWVNAIAEVTRPVDVSPDASPEEIRDATIEAFEGDSRFQPSETDVVAYRWEIVRHSEDATVVSFEAAPSGRLP